MAHTSENEAARDERDDNVLKLPPKEEAWNPFDVEALKALGRGDEAAVEKVLLKVEVRKPRKGEFFRTHPNPEMSVTTKLYKSDDGETFLVNPAVSDVFGRQIVRVTLYYCVSRYGHPFLWPVRVPEDGEKDNSYWQTARLAADKAIEAWIRIEANQTAKNYSLALARGDLPEPRWPDLPLREVLELAFRDATINDRDHLLVKSFLGEV